MLSKKQLDEIREHLERAQNPVFYFDNDADGLCSYLILRRLIGRGKGVAIRSFPELSASYARKVQELNADYVFILDKPLVSKEFFADVETMNVPVVWIDHHEVEFNEGEHKNVFLFNPLRAKEKSEEPVTFIAYEVSKRKEDLWLAMIGCVSDHFIPPFADEFAIMYPDFWGEVKTPAEAYFKTGVGNLGRTFNFGLKDSTSNIVRLQNFLISCNGPINVMEEVNGNHPLRKKYFELKKKYDVLLEKARRNYGQKVLYFEYGGELSISSDLSNELSFIYPKKYIIVAYKNGSVVNISLRGKGVKKILEIVLKEVEGSGGGHDDAVGARISVTNLEKFREVFENKVVLTVKEI